MTRTEQQVPQVNTISYPNKRDREYAGQRGMDPGGDIMIHGQPNGYGRAAPILQLFSSTDECIAPSDSNMDIIWESIDPEIAIEIHS
jgi:murein L,D-transpeptidase YafK